MGRPRKEDTEATQVIKADEPEYPDTPSGVALREVGNVNGEDVDWANDKEADAARAQGEAYAAAKSKARWG